MADGVVGRLSAYERWFDETMAAAEPLLPALLDLSGPALSAELQRHPELLAALLYKF